MTAVALGGCSGANAAPTWTFSPISIAAAAAGAPTASSPSASLVPTASAAPVASTIGLSEWNVDIASAIPAGTATFTISNNGTIPHELLVFKSDLAPSAYPVDKSGDIVEDGPGISLLSDGDNIDPGGSQTRAVDLVPGTYLFVCNIPGHFKAGMFTVVTVSP